jgi:hypothetical protein
MIQAGMFGRLGNTVTDSHGPTEGWWRLWTVSWTGIPPEPRDIGDIRALASRVSAGRNLGAAERTYGKENVYGSIP